MQSSPTTAPDSSLEDRIADIVLARFNELPAKSKPATDNEGNRSWVPLSGIVLSKVPQAQGFVLHDWHAEILAIRGFNHYLLQECHRFVESSEHTSPFIRRRNEGEESLSRGLQPFTIQERVKIYMYCSEAPCGDASMELTMSNQEDDTPWAVLPKVTDTDQPEMLKGRGYFSELGIVRRKPSRPDSPPSLSKSCSDKLALKQCTSLLSSPASLLFSPENAYLHSLILPSSQYVDSACDRAFGRTGRMKSVLNQQWNGSYVFRPFQVKTTGREFKFSRRSLGSAAPTPKSSNISALWTPVLQETLINGVLQGRKQTDPRGGSAVCRLRMGGLAMNLLRALAIPAFAHAVASPRYSDLKKTQPLENRRIVKEDARREALKGWVRNVEDDFELIPV
ncbi:MAG: hypothetical protein Q9187_005696 [Circinaria calcarea]